MNEWQPIATAPSDGSEVIIHRIYPVVQVLVTSADGEWWRRAAKDGIRSVPVHWMPLPPPPAADGEAG